MNTLIDFILDLFRSPASAAAFVMDPDGALRDAGLPNVTAAQLASVAATAAPAGYALGGGDPIVGLQRAVADHHQLASNFASPFSPQTSWAPTFAPETDTDLLSGNNVPVASPVQDAGANAQNGAFNLGFGDITFGDKTSNTATDGGVVVDGDNDGDIVTGDGAALGDGNTMNNGDILAGSGSNVVVGKDNEVEDNSQTAGGDLIADNDAPVLNDVDTSGGNGGGADGGGSLIGIGSGNAAGGDGGSGGGIIITDNDVNTGTQIDGNYGSDNVEDNSVNTAVETDIATSTESSVEDNSSAYESNIGSGNETAIGSGNETNTDLFSDNVTDIETDTDLASNNDTLAALDAF
ncbi:IniB N-terminal domain-containing protein [Mycolicibacterium austroafricanum]|uniref:IniB N-terminal domain-containing protein n=1 Tax=Mycolicibacterium austroafricanum TaxID=39687 RepID=A0ABT8HFW0_MYCAO|nr:IniB N-terminal domain-containing protein [Mycolicibacterium austroafricanum]MDN4519152.1 IniB N-terminal domain-containing protein [Mycolicibacterium austroafricanum]QRZ07363.1 IniB N-terminal domain-containing protein [Mycolicibacterium austroafricanum]QZT69026.1 IniB N-terminal domain-containing protein [Mycolicibacterium austroafricanum]